MGQYIKFSATFQKTGRYPVWARVKEACQFDKISGAQRRINFRHFRSL
jgi:hypothetical protein